MFNPKIKTFTMAKYIKKEMADLNGTGTTQAYYRMQTWEKLTFGEFVRRCHLAHGAFDKGTIEGVVMSVCEQLAFELANGYSVKIDGLGTFRAKLGLRPNKEMDSFEEGEPRHNALSIRVTGVSFRADKRFVGETDRSCDLERGGEDRLCKSAFTQQERLQKAQEYLREKGFMRVGDYASLTGQSYATACRELRRFTSDPASGIISQGRKSAKLYLLASL